MKKPPAVVVVLLVISQSFVPGSAVACGHVSLWDDIAEADLIVVARVESIEENRSESDPTMGEPGTDRKKVTLRILETWKGSPETEVVVDFPWDVPDGFDVDDIVIQFLERGESQAERTRQALTDMEAYMAEVARDPEATGDIDDWTPDDQEESWQRLEQFANWSAGRWFPISVWPELRTGDEEVRKTARALIERAVLLQAAKAGEEDRAEWSVTAVEHHSTRRYGLWELTAERLTDDQLRRLAAAFVREPAVDETDFYFLKLFAGYSSFDVDRAAAAVIEAGFLIEPIPWWVTVMVDEALKRYGDSFADRIGRDDRDSRGRLIYTGKGENTLPTIWEVARRQLGIPWVLPAEAPKRLWKDGAD
jgi:hypothetical protein